MKIKEIKKEEKLNKKDKPTEKSKEESKEEVVVNIPSKSEDNNIEILKTEEGVGDEEIKQFSEDGWTKTEEKKENSSEITTQDFSLEEVVSDASPKTNNFETEIRPVENFYSTGNTNFYSSGASDFYSTGISNDLYSTNGSSMYGTSPYTANQNGNFYNGQNKEDEKIGEIRAEKISKLEMEGARGNLKRDNRKSENDKYKTKTY